MFDVMHLFISPALAETATAASPVAGASNALMQFLPFFLILGVFYMMMIRPQQKKLEAQENMLKALKKGDKVITNGGIVATIHKVEDDDYLQVDIAEGVRVKLLRSGVSSLVPVEPIAAKNDNKKD